MPSVLEVLSGHNAKTAKGHSLDERQLLRHLGAAVLIATITAAANWGVAAFMLSKDNGLPAAIAIAIAAGLLGATIVLVVDRTSLFLLDAHAIKRMPFVLFVAVRISLVCLVGMNSAPGMLGLLMKDELKIEALHMLEASGDARNRRLAERQDLPALQSQVNQAEIDAAEAHKATSIIPPEVKQKRDVALACRTDYARRRTSLIGQGVEPAEAIRELASLSARCNRQQAEAQIAHKAYVDRTTTAAKEADDKLQQANAAIDKSNADIKARAAGAEAIEGAALNPQSSLVIESLLNHSRGAYARFLGIMIVIVMLEMLPFVTKIFAPRSIPGTRIATEHAIAAAKYERRQNAAVEEVVIASAVRSMLSSAMLDALACPEARGQIEQGLARNVAALAPFEMFNALLREIEAAELKVVAAVQEYPSSAEAITALYEKTLDEVVKAASGRPRSPVTIRNAA